MDAPPLVNAYALSPAIAAASSFLLFSYMALAVSPSTHVFSTVTNFCYLAAGFYREAASLATHHSAASLVGQSGGSAMILVLMGASSFAFHRESQLNSPAHTLDILFGWVLVSHLFYVCCSVSVLGYLRWLLPDALEPPVMRVLRAALSFSFLLVIVLLMAFYDTVYEHQAFLYSVLGPGAALFGATLRALLVLVEGQSNGRAVFLAIVEGVVLLTVVVAAIYAQGELAGRTLTQATTPREYDFYHGNWHFLLAVATSVLYSRTADAARVVQDSYEICICELPFFDKVGIGVLFLYSVCVMLLKELAVDLDVSIVVLSVVASAFTAHALATLCARL